MGIGDEAMEGIMGDGYTLKGRCESLVVLR